MSEYNPDNWVMIKIQSEQQTFYKILGGWSGGYLDGDSWRMNSGVTSVKQEGEYYHFYGASGSVYKCHKSSNTVRMNIAGIVSQVEAKEGVQVMPTDTDYMNIKY